MMDVLFHAFVLSSILLAIHGYFGLEIVRRGIIFTDLALGQFSALGLAVSLAFLEGHAAYGLALGFALLGGVLVWLGERKGVFTEAWIGILYALGVSSAMLLLSRSPRGAEEFLHLTASDILFTPWETTLRTGLYYGGVGLLLLLRERWIQGMWGDLMFFLLFAVTITSSVKLAGVLVVFAILLAPALVARLWGRGIGFVWAWGTVWNLLALGVSWRFDLPTGFSVVFFQSVAAGSAYLLSACVDRFSWVRYN